MPHRSYLLELTSAADFRPKPFPRDDIALTRAAPAIAERCQDLWVGVGRDFWLERSDWSIAQWRDHLGKPEIYFAIATAVREDIGFFELQRTSDGTEFEGFGLVSAWRNRGLGGGLLSAATQSAFDAGARRVWLHTATDDHPHALPNYQARGYRIYHEEDLNDPMPGPRNGAQI